MLHFYFHCTPYNGVKTWTMSADPCQCRQSNPNTLLFVLIPTPNLVITKPCGRLACFPPFPGSQNVTQHNQSQRTDKAAENILRSNYLGDSQLPNNTWQKPLDLSARQRGDTIVCWCWRCVPCAHCNR